MDLEKFAEAFAKRGLVPSIHIHEGNQIHDNQIERLYLGAEPQEDKTEEETPDNEELPPELLMVLKGDRKLCRDIVRQAPFIVYAADFRVQLRPVFDRHNFSLRTLNRREFFAAYIPLLTNYKNKKSVETLCHTTFL